MTAGERVTSAEEVSRVLEERARALARPVAAAPVEEMLDLITFSLANETYAVESRYVVAVFRLTDLSPLPGATLPVVGVTAWRGELLTILDLRAVLGLSITALNDLSRVIVLGEDRPIAGILADAVREVMTLQASAVLARPLAVGVQRDLVRGVTVDALLLLAGQHLMRMLGPDPPAVGAGT